MADRPLRGWTEYEVCLRGGIRCAVVGVQCPGDEDQLGPGGGGEENWEQPLRKLVQRGGSEPSQSQEVIADRCHTLRV